MLLIVRFWGWKRILMALVLVICFQKLRNMLLLKRRYAKILGLFQSNLWSSKFGKGRQEWMKTCINYGIRPRKLNTFVKTW